ncbi:MAG TPA: DUF3343 domain-containing protein [Oscillospiraceae bacterium]|nr:DUF3343 domain-containing protein [Oscillospiraceae bacterium]HNX99310.1 DUF3343 domain-containing protein [Oscillospiraceae bacterium]HPS74960.1 DUF3343 domain-containing protein [Oscillospiraceae bacterium]
MLHYLIMTRSLTYAQRAARLLERAGITAAVIKAPQSVSVNGCAYCVSVSYKHGPRAVKLLDEADLRSGRIFLQEADGTLREAKL